MVRGGRRPVNHGSDGKEPDTDTLHAGELRAAHQGRDGNSRTGENAPPHAGGNPATGRGRGWSGSDVPGRAGEASGQAGGSAQAQPGECGKSPVACTVWSDGGADAGPPGGNIRAGKKNPSVSL